MPAPRDDSPMIILTTAPTTSHAAQIIYGLELRGATASVIPNPVKARDPYAITLIKGEALIARAAIESIWDALLENTPRAADNHGHCYFCGYNTTGLTRPVICPECGRNLDSIESRRIADEGRI